MVAGPSQPAQPPGGTQFQHEVRAAAATAQTQPLDHRPQQIQYQQHINHPQPPLQLQTPQQATTARKREAEKKPKRELEREKAEEEDFNMGKKGGRKFIAVLIGSFRTVLKTQRLINNNCSVAAYQNG